MGWDGAGGYNRERNFSADQSAGIKILASAVDQELDDVASAFTNTRALDGQNSPSDNLPMGGNRHVNVAAAASASDYMRANEFVTQVPIYVEDAESGDTSKVSVSASFYTTVSANQAPPDGSKLVFRAASFKSASCALYLNAGGGTPYSANIVDDEGNHIWHGAIVSGGVYDVVYSSSEASWRLMNPTNGIVSISCNVKVVENTSASVLGRHDGRNVFISRYKKMLMYQNEASVSVSVSAAADNYRVVFSTDTGKFNGWSPLGAHFAGHVYVPILNAGNVRQMDMPFFTSTQSLFNRGIIGHEWPDHSVSADVAIVVPPFVLHGLVRVSADD